MITFRQKGNFSKVNKFFEKAAEGVHLGLLDKYGRMGVSALESATPKDSGKTASSWSYNITHENGIATLNFNNDNIQNGYSVAILIQYGHGLKGGGYVEGIDYINPALRSTFEGLAKDAWKEVTKA